ncbi:MAG TPA: hypothetical protein VKQ36_02480 [Ktedonobacterales bacterium]|nr:hypothetical protein [Ktedonobacterales bacterium]
MATTNTPSKGANRRNTSQTSRSHMRNIPNASNGTKTPLAAPSAASSKPAPESAPTTAEPPTIEHAAIHLYQLYDVSYSIDLERARATLATPIERVRPVVTRGASIDIAQLPLETSLGNVEFELCGKPITGALYGRIYDLGILAFRLVIVLNERMSWEDAIAMLCEAQADPTVVMEAFERGLALLIKTLGDAIIRPNQTVRTEDYTIFVVERMTQGETPASQLGRHPALLRAALGERRPLSASVAALATPLSYYEDDLILLTWSSAVVIEPDKAARDDTTLLLEFANAQLLAFRSYDAEVERELARITPRIGRLGRWVIFGSTRRFLFEIHTLIADITDSSGRVENALKVTEDVYWNRVYTAALSVLRVEVWRTGVAETLAALNQTASLLHDEEQAARSNLMEILVILLIAIELIVAIIGLRPGFH